MLSSADTFVHDGTPDDNYGSEEFLIVKWHPTAGNDREAFFKFALNHKAACRAECSAVPTYHFSVSGYGNDPAHLAVAVFEAPCTWDEGTLTWNNKPTAGALIGYQDMPLPPNATRGEAQDMTMLVSSLVAAGAPELCFVVKATASVAGDTGRLMESRESSAPPRVDVACEREASAHTARPPDFA